MRKIVGYDLINGSSEDYNNIIDYLENRLKAKRMTESCWAFNSNLDNESLFNTIKSQVKCDIRLFVYDFDGNGYIGNLYCDASELKALRYL